ncbi:class II glutamine amidotransferase [Sorangium sp. So ce119]|uniref:class II glutamine amidotransferase n=1 Tax=Sorangium sp. So ce119 TaxID=3133279 RepID=UPI003F636CCC
MCRLILAHGRFSTVALLDAAVAMSTGRTAEHEGPTRRHPNGWGAVFRDPRAPHGLAVHRDVRPIEHSVGESIVPRVDTDFLVVHVRHATLARNQGIGCTHPIARHGARGPFYFLHNGFMPTVYQRLGRERSEFDSAEYLDYLLPEGEEALDVDAATARLRDIPHGGTSANAILVSPRRAHVIHWTPEDTPYPRYFAMHRLALRDCTVIASEIIPALAPRERWEPLPPRDIVQIEIHRG